MKSKLAPAFALLAITSCAAASPGAGAHLSAAGQDAAARADDREATQHAAAFDPAASRYRERCVGHPEPVADGFGECWYDRLNATTVQLTAAREHRRAAAEHRAASRALREAEERACTGLSEHDRDVSPFAHRTDILRVTQLPRGAIVLFRQVPAMTAAGLQKIVDCHLARNDALGHDVPWMLYCPLVPRDVTAKVTQEADGLSIRIETPDPDAAREVKYRVGALITP